jgi:hypothetical protein
MFQPSHPESVQKHQEIRQIRVVPDHFWATTCCLAALWSDSA